MKQDKQSGIATSRWLPAESVVVLSPETVNAKGAERSKRYVGNAPYQQAGCVAKATNGDLLVMTTLADPSHTVLLRSSDGGHTWSKPSFVWENQSAKEYAAGVSAMTVLRSGRILAIINGEYPGWPEDYRRPTWSLYSDDNGATWNQSPPVPAVPPFLSCITYFQMTEMADGTIILPIGGHMRRQDTSVERLTGGNGFLISRDGGFGWQFGGVVMKGDPSIGTAPNEIAILPLASGTWLAMFRMNWVKPSDFPSVMLFRSISHDRGRAWSAPQLVLGATGYVCLQQLPDGGVMVSGSGSFGVRYLVSYDDGRSWAYEQLLESSGDSNTTSVVLDNKTVFLVHGSGMGQPHHPAYWYAGLRGRWIRKT